MKNRRPDRRPKSRVKSHEAQPPSTPEVNVDPRPPPVEKRELDRAAKPGRPVKAAKREPTQAALTPVPYDPKRVRQFILGQITLGDLEGINKRQQYAMAEEGFRQLSQGKLEVARKIFDGLASLDPFDAYFQLALGSVEHRRGALEEAEQRYTRSLGINPYSATALANRGEVRVLLGRLAPGSEDLAAAIALDPQAKEPSVQRAQVLIGSVLRELQARGIRAPKPPLKRLANARAQEPRSWRSMLGDSVVGTPGRKSGAADAKAALISRHLASFEGKESPSPSSPVSASRSPSGSALVTAQDTGAKRRVGGARQRIRRFPKQS